MFCRTIVAFSTGMMVVGLTFSVNAKPVPTTHSRAGKVSVSSDSLQGLNSRGITDYPGITQNSDEFGITHPGLPIAQSSHPKDKVPPLFRKIGNQVKVNTGTQLGTQNTPEPLRLTEDNGEYNENFSVQYKLNR